MKLHEKTIDAMNMMCAAGYNLTDAANAFGIHVETMRQRAKKYGVAFTAAPRSVHGSSMHSGDMARMYTDNGLTLEQIGSHYGITRERVRQILTKKCGITKKDSGNARNLVEKIEERKREKKREKEADMAVSAQKIGCSVEQYAEMVDMGKVMAANGDGYFGRPLYVFRSRKATFQRQGVEWALTAGEWWDLWKAAGGWLLSEKGYWLQRIDKSKGFVPGNVHIVPPGKRHMRTIATHTEQATA